MNELNPYAPPPIIADNIAPLGTFGDSGGVWRQDDVLVMRKDARLPARCVKSNEPTQTYLPRNFTWHPQWVYLLILVAVPVYLIVAIVLQKKAHVNIGLSPAWKARRRNRILTAWGLVAISFVLFFGGIVYADPEQPGMLFVLGGLIVFVVGIIYGIVGANLVSVKKIDDQFVWLAGVCPEYLATLPPWTGPRA